MDSTSFLIKYLPVTDWIQALGAVIAIIAGIWGFIALFKKDKDKEKQIKSLIGLAEESKKQTAEMIKQSKSMETQIKTMSEDFRFKISTRLNDVKPHFIRKISGLISSRGEIELINKGKGLAKNLRLKVLESNVNNIRFFNLSPVIYVGEEVKINFDLDAVLPSLCSFTIDVGFDDQDNAPYSQKIKWIDFKLIVDQPISHLFDVNNL